MTIGPVKAFSVTASSGVTYTSAIDLAGAYGKYLFVIPTMTSGSDLGLLVSDTEDGTFRRLYAKAIVTPTFTVAAMNFDSAITNCAIPIEVSAQFIKVEIKSAMTASTAQFQFICCSN
jgi:hypothetical protein